MTKNGKDTYITRGGMEKLIGAKSNGNLCLMKHISWEKDFNKQRMNYSYN